MLIPHGDYLVSVWLHGCDDLDGFPLGHRMNLIALYGDVGRWKVSHEPFSRPDQARVFDELLDGVNRASVARRLVQDKIIIPTTLESSGDGRAVRTLEVEVKSSEPKQMRRSVLEGVLGPLLRKRPKVIP